MNSTIRDYYFSDAFTAKATVLELTAASGGVIVILDRTVFVPQGGGQPSDTGTIDRASVTHVEAVKERPDIIAHTIVSPNGLAEGAKVDIRIDASRRQLHSRLHTAGHLIAALVEEILPETKAIGGHHWPGEGRVEFAFDGVLPSAFERTINAAISNAIAADLLVKCIPSHEGVRYVRIAEFPALRCGGTHCWHLKGVGSVALRGIKQRKGKLRIGYDVSDALSNEPHA